MNGACSTCGRDYLEDQYRWEDNTGMDLGEIGWEVLDWIHLTG